MNCLPASALSGSGELTGTPTDRGTYDFQVQLNDSASPPVTTIGRFSLVVTTPRLLITTRSVPSAMVGRPLLGSARFRGRPATLDLVRQVGLALCRALAQRLGDA